MAESLQGPSRALPDHPDDALLRRYWASAVAVLVAMVWTIWLIPPSLAGAPPREAAFALPRAALLALAAGLTLRHAFAHDLPRRMRHSWIFIGAAIASVALGELHRTALDLGGWKRPPIGLSDLFYLGYFPLLLAGLLQLPRMFGNRSDLGRFLLDCAIVAVGGGMFIWHLGIRPALLAGAESEPGIGFIAAAYPIGDLLTLVGLATVLLRLPVGPTRAVYRWLGASLAASLAGDLVWILTQLLAHRTPVYAEMLWFAQAVFLVWMADVAQRRRRAFREPRGERAGRFAALPYVSLAAGYALIGYVALHPDDDRGAALPSLLAWGAVLLVCVILRQSLASRENAALHGERTRLAGEARLAKLIENAADGIFVLDRTHRVVYASPSALRLLGAREPRVIGQPITGFLPSDDAESLRAFLGSLDRDTGRRGGKLMLRFAADDGRAAWTETTVTDERHDPNLSGVVLNVRDMTEHHRLEAQMQHEALHDALTQLPNRELLLDRIARAIDHARRDGGSLAVAVLDIDRFRLINDSLGHATGDQAILLVAERLKGALRGGDTLARLGADEFAMLFDDVRDVASLKPRLDRMLASFSGPLRFGRHSVRLTAGMGVAMLRDDARADDLLRDADTAVSIAKREGANRYHLFEPVMHVQVMERLTIQATVMDGLDHDRFEVHLQPVVGLVDGYPIALRPRLRWRDPANAPFPIERLRDVVPDVDVAARLGDWLLATAQREYTSLLRYQPGAASLSLLMPMDGRFLQQDGLVPRVSDLLEQIGMPAVNLMVAVSEEAIGGADDAALRPLRQLRGLGVRLALAGFGSRASSLAVLHEPLFDALLLSRGLSQGLALGGRSQTLVRGVVALAETLGARAIATGVDGADVRDALSELGCLYGIGSALAPPMPLERLLPWLGGRLSDSGR